MSLASVSSLLDQATELEFVSGLHLAASSSCRMDHVKGCAQVVYSYCMLTTKGYRDVANKDKIKDLISAQDVWISELEDTIE